MTLYLLVELSAHLIITSNGYFEFFLLYSSLHLKKKILLLSYTLVNVSEDFASSHPPSKKSKTGKEGKVQEKQISSEPIKSSRTVKER